MFVVQVFFVIVIVSRFVLITYFVYILWLDIARGSTVRVNICCKF